MPLLMVVRVIKPFLKENVVRGEAANFYLKQLNSVYFLL